MEYLYVYMSLATADGKNTTCSVMAEIAANVELFNCTADTTEPCDTVDCTTNIGYTAEFVLLPCLTPPAVRLVVYLDKWVVVSRTLNHSAVIVIPELFDLVVNVTIHQFDDAIGLQVCNNNVYYLL